MIGRILERFRTRAAAGGASLAELRARGSEIAARLREAMAGLHSRAQSQPVVDALDACAVHVESIASQTAIQLRRLAGKRVAAGDYFRLIQTTYRTIRTPAQPDMLRTLQVIVFFWMLETVMAGGVMISGGKMDVAAGFAYGMIFALVNIILGVLTGFLGLRYLGHRPIYDIFDAAGSARTSPSAIRVTAIIGTALGVSGEAVLIFSAARLRALGTHEGVFDFTDVGFWATYDDSLAIVITVIGVCSAVLAIREGYGGIADPIPGYGAAYDQATTDIDAAADEVAEDAIAIIEDASDAALETGEDALAGGVDGPDGLKTQLLEIARDIDAHNDAVRAAKEVAETASSRRASVDRFVGGGAAPKQPISDLSAYDALILPRIDQIIAECSAANTADDVPIRAAMSALEAACTRAFADIRAALADHHAGAPNLDELFNEGDHNAAL